MGHRGGAKREGDEGNERRSRDKTRGRSRHCSQSDEIGFYTHFLEKRTTLL